MNAEDNADWSYTTIRAAIDEAKSNLEADDGKYDIDADGVSTYEQVKAIHDYLLDTVSYVKDSSRVEGGDITLTATVFPTTASNQKVIWSSSNPRVATVDQNGCVVPLSSGSVVITATTMEGGFTDTCSFTVEDKATIIGQVDVLQQGVVMNTGETFAFAAVVRPTDTAIQSVSWSSSDESVATVSEYGTIEALKAGTTTIKLYFADYPSVYATCELTVK